MRPFTRSPGVLTQLKGAGVISGWRDELYPVTPAFDSPPALLIERAAAPHFGIRAYGVHINGWVAGDDGRPASLWVARRSPTKQTWPGKLDHIVAGGQARSRVVASCACYAAPLCVLHGASHDDDLPAAVGHYVCG